MKVTVLKEVSIMGIHSFCVYDEGIFIGAFNYQNVSPQSTLQTEMNAKKLAMQLAKEIEAGTKPTKETIYQTP